MRTVAAVLVFAILAVAVQALSLEEGRVAFGNWAVLHGKQYETEAHSQRALAAYMENDDLIAAMNAVPTDGATYGHNLFSDMTTTEFRAFFTQPAGIPGRVPAGANLFEATGASVPDSFDWRSDSRGVVGPVKNQGQCGSCWAFSGTFAVEAAHVIAGNSYTSLAEQQIVDCDHESVQYEGQSVQMAGCQGGFPWSVYEYSKTAGGMEAETSYPYMAIDQTCAFDSSKVAVPAPTSWKFVTTSNDETAMAEALATASPLSIALDATYMQFYVGGISNPLLCSKTRLDHAVAIVAYSSEKTLLHPGGEDYWVIRNSWGATWGEKGYIKMKKGSNTCGLASVPSFATA